MRTPIRPGGGYDYGNSLRIEIQVRAIHLIKPPKEILRSTVDIIATGIVWEIVAKWRARELLSK